MLKVFWISLLLSTYAPTAPARDDCAVSFAHLTSHLVTPKDVPENYKVAILEAAEAQYRKMTAGLNPKQLKSFHESLSKSRISKDVPASANGQTRHPLFGVARFHITPEASEKALAMSTILHESQHLIDEILKPRSVWNAKSYTYRRERRAFLRQNIFLQDVVEKIGTDGLADLLMRSAKIPAENHLAAKRLVEFMMSAPKDREVKFGSVDRIVIGKLLDTLPDDRKKLAIRFLGDLTNLSDRRTYLELGDHYKDRIQLEQMLRITRRHDEELSVLFRLIFAGLVAKEGYDFITREPNK